MLRTALVAGGAALGVILIYRNLVADAVPDRVLIGRPEVTSDDVGLALSMAFVAPMLAGFIRKAAPGG